MAAGAIYRLVRRESCQRRTFRESVLTAVRRVVLMPPIPTPCDGSHRYTAAPTSRSPCGRSEAPSQKRLCVISKRSRSEGHQERTPEVFHPPAGHSALFSKVQAVKAVACSPHLPLSTP